jgi:hypothetical protein
MENDSTERGTRKEQQAAKSVLKPIGASVPFAAFLMLVFLYLWLWVDSSLLYHGAGAVSFPVFSLSTAFVEGLLHDPGGPVECLAALLAQAYYYPWAGALAIVAVAGLLGVATRSLARSAAGAAIPGVWSVPALLAVVLANRYVYKLDLFVAALVAAACACIYFRTVRGGLRTRFAAFLTLFAAVYYLAGGACFLYAALCCVAELGVRRTLLIPALYALVAGLAPYVFGMRLLHLRPSNAYVRNLPYHPEADPLGEPMVVALYLSLLLIPLGGAVWQWFAKRRRHAFAGGDGTGSAARPSEPGGAGADAPGVSVDAPANKAGGMARVRALLARPAFELEVVLIAATLVALLSHDENRKSLWQLGKYASERKWSEVLEEAQGLKQPGYSFAALSLVTRALYETRRLPNEMFAYRQHHGGFSLAWGMDSKRLVPLVRRVAPLVVEKVDAPGLVGTNWYSMRMQNFFAIGDLNVQLGLVNEAEHESYEALEIFGEDPRILKQLALIHIVKGQTGAAERFLHALSTHLHYRDYARERLQRLRLDPLLAKDEEVERIRSVMATNERMELDRSLETRFDELLRRNPRNRMAYEYRMAFYLVNLQIENLVRHLDILPRFDYPDTPRHYQEAVIIYESITGQKVDLHGREISAQARQAYQEFLTILDVFHRRGDRPGAQDLLGRRFGQTYFYFYFLGEA